MFAIVFGIWSIAEVATKITLWVYLFKYTNTVDENCTEVLAQQRARAIETEIATGEKVPESALTTMD